MKRRHKRSSTCEFTVSKLEVEVEMLRYCASQTSVRTLLHQDICVWKNPNAAPICIVHNDFSFPLQTGERCAKNKRKVSFLLLLQPSVRLSKARQQQKVDGVHLLCFHRATKNTHLLLPSAVCKPNSVLIRPDAAVCWACLWCNAAAGKYRWRHFIYFPRVCCWVFFCHIVKTVLLHFIAPKATRGRVTVNPYAHRGRCLSGVTHGVISCFLFKTN